MEPGLNEEREGLDAILFAPEFRLLTTLQYHFFVKQSDGDDVDTIDAVERWMTTSAKLLDLHIRRLREAAEALRWSDVAQRLGAEEEVSIPNGGHQRASPPCRSSLNLKALFEEAAGKHFPELETLQQSLSPSGNTTSARVRVLISRSGDATVEFGPQLSTSTSTLLQQLQMYTTCPFQAAVPERTPSKISLSIRPVIPSFFTRHKTTHRTVYNDARQQVEPPLLPTDLPTDKEVLLFNTDNEIMEASLSSVYFQRNGKWITPSIECGGHQSVTKLYALENGWCIGGVIKRSEVRDGEMIWLSNAVRGFFPGVLALKAAEC